MTDERTPRSHLDGDIRVLETKFEHVVNGLTSLERAMGSRLDAIDRKIEGLPITYATKAELEVIGTKVKSLSDNVGWFIKLVLGTVTLAILGLVIAKGGTFHG